ncbi:anhydro-N-acetylmuramic acid kinase [Marinospirillum sp.]|uniref:anhydro-N-acetylmuramic acid kinase n=1 Tax=Marinospirillum sp. TaxID=2183934 RepID=UPI00384F3C97
MTNRKIYGGLMSGTSLDGVDGLLLSFTGDHQLQVLARSSLPFPDELRDRLLNLAQSENISFTHLADAEQALTRHYALCWQELEKQAPGIRPEALGCHGQTLEHRPAIGYSLQLLDPSLLAELTGCNIVCDFRRRDLAAGGQGAPLVPAFHRGFLSSAKEDQIIVNLGGIANLTWLPCNPAQESLGFDTGPANLLLDAWCCKHRGTKQDENGHWARSGQANQKLLDQLLKEAYFSAPYPKSTGREMFNLAWLERQLEENDAQNLNAADIQATLVELTAASLCQAIQQLDPQQKARVLICGGGSKNTYLMERITGLARPRSVATTESAGLPPQDVEAAAFAWLAQQHLLNKPGNLPSATGAQGPRVLGGFYPA